MANAHPVAALQCRNCHSLFPVDQIVITTDPTDRMTLKNRCDCCFTLEHLLDDMQHIEANDRRRPFILHMLRAIFKFLVTFS